jgi:hypothetical protein
VQKPFWKQAVLATEQLLLLRRATPSRQCLFSLFAGNTFVHVIICHAFVASCDVTNTNDITDTNTNPTEYST